MPRLRTLVALVVVLALAAPVVSQADEPHLAAIDPVLRTQLAATGGPVGVIVSFADAPTDADGQALLEAGFAPGLVRYRVVPAVYGLATAGAVEAIRRNGRVVRVEADRSLEYQLDRAT